MFTLRRKAVQSAERLPVVTRRSVQRYSTTGHGKTGEDAHHGSSTDHGHHHAEPVNEPLGAQLYIVLAAIPISMGIYAASRPGADGKPTAFTKLIEKYSEYKEQIEYRNALHTRLVEEAAFNRNLFQSTPGSKHINLKFPEVFNTGSPYNVVAGASARNFDQLVAHYEKKNMEHDAKVLRKMAERGE